MKRNEIQYWNLVKTIAIIMVVFCHMPFLNENKWNNLSQLITFAAVPLFLMVNGAALFSADFNSEKHFRKILHIFLTYLAWRGIYLLFSLWWGLTVIESISVRSVILYFIGNSINGVPAGPLWFLEALLACYVLFPFFKLLFDRQEYRKYIYLLCGVMYICMFLRHDILLHQEAMLNCGLISKEEVLKLTYLEKYNPIAIWGIFYFILGGLLHEKLYHPSNRTHWKKLICCGTGAVIFAAWLFVIKGSISGYTGTKLNDFSKYGINGVYQTTTVLLLSVCILLFCMQIYYRDGWTNRFIRLIGRNTLPVYYMHYVGAHVLRDCIPWFSHHPGIAANCIKTIILMLCCHLLYCVMKKIPVLNRLF